GWKAYIRGITGDRAFANTVARQLTSATPLPWFGHTSLASCALAVGDTAKALRELDLATDRRENWATSFAVSDPMFDVVRGSAHWSALLKRIGLDKPVVTTGTP